MATKVPDRIKFYDENGSILENDTSKVIEALVKKFKVTGVKDEYNNKSSSEIVRDFLTIHLNAGDETPSVPEGLEKYSSLFDTIGNYVADHLKATKEEADKKDLEKTAKAEARQAEKERKEAENKTYSDNASLFEKSMEAMSSKVTSREKLVESVIKSIKLPSNISLTENGQGLVFGENVTPKDIGAAASSVIAAMEGQAALQGTVQFLMGDLVNKAVDAKVYRSKNEAQGGIAHVVKEKLGKDYAPSSLNQFAKTAERVPAAKRKLGIAPSMYIFAAKVAPPKLKDSDKEAQAKVEKEFEERREQLIDGINNGDIKTVKELQAKIVEFNEKAGVGPKASPAAKKAAEYKFLKQFFFSHWIKKYVVGVHKEGVATLRLADGKNVELTVGDLTDLEEEASNNLQNMLIVEPTASINGSKEVLDKDNKPVKEKYFMIYPFAVEEENSNEEAKAPEGEKAPEEAKAPEATEGVAEGTEASEEAEEGSDL